MNALQPSCFAMAKFVLNTSNIMIITNSIFVFTLYTEKKNYDIIR